ncbi:LysR family transcriptional regulator [Streptomyces solincola]|uniref:LysR family transcriptional regulator n=1 Tax=Streptomyces solincola TaxID=2100817 RepID=A0A2S9PMX4_9ACTN|nr:LysR family substrate-binding domain-containing protein [Streptomyces solincola]PRH75779.1 LysR family transcriptional regulator [Streptomyces solincola]
MTGSEAIPPFRLAYVPGVTPAKWVRIWQERLPDVPLDLVQLPSPELPGALRAGEADAGFLRLPGDRDELSAIPLYTETTVVVVPKDHLVAAVDEVALADLADDVLFHPLDDVFDWERPPGRPAIDRPATTADAIELVAAGVGLLVVPQSLARLHHRRDLTYRPVTDAPQSRVALSWPEERTTDRVEDLIGIVRGRTVNSTRGRRPDTDQRPEKQPAKQSGKQSTGSRGTKSSGGTKSGSGTRSGGAARRAAPGRSAGAGRGKPRRRG